MVLRCGISAAREAIVKSEQDFDAEGWALDLERRTKKFDSLLKRERLALQSWNWLRDGGVDVESLPG